MYVTGLVYNGTWGLGSCPIPQQVFVRKYTHAGTHVWTRQFGTAVTIRVDGCRVGVGIQGNGIAVDGTGVYVTGTTSGALPGFRHAGKQDIFVRKYTHDGARVWTKQAGTPADDTASDLALDPQGVYIAGATTGAWPGGTNEPGDSDAFVRKYTRSGGLIWTRQFGSVAPDFAASIAGVGAVFYVGGSTAGTFPGQMRKGGADAWVRKLGGNGTLLWTRQFGTSEDDSMYGLDADASGVFLTGGTTGAFPGYTKPDEPDAFVTSYSSAGDRGWTRQFPSTDKWDSGSWGSGIALGPPSRDTQEDERQGVYVTGVWGSQDDPRYHRGFLRKHER